MALNIHTFRTRSITALVFVIIMLCGLFINRISFTGLMLLIFAGCMYEWFKMSKLIAFKNKSIAFILGCIYISAAVGSMLSLGASGQSSADRYAPLLPCAVFFSIWINDTMAYIVGSFIGKTPFSPISPKKTWEGTIGGALLCIISIAILGTFVAQAKSISTFHWIIISGLGAIFGTLGDLLESKMKRMAGVKDSGSFMPGHGGFLDRFDSMLMTAPIVWLYMKLFL